MMDQVRAEVKQKEIEMKEAKVANKLNLLEQQKKYKKMEK